MLLVAKAIDLLARFAEVVISTAIAGYSFAGTELVKQLRLSQHAYPRRRNPLYKLIEIALFGVSPLYTKSSQNERSNVMEAQQQQFISAAKDIVNICKGERTFKRRWMGKFGAIPVVCCLLWNRIDPYVTMPDGVHKKHLLWALYFLKAYDTEENSAQSVGG